MKMNTSAIEAVAATVNSEIVAFRSKAVSSENAATPLARSILAAMVAGVATETTVTVMVLHSFGNPKSPKGKQLEKLSGSGDHVPGFGATRKTIASIFDVFANIDFDAPREVDEVTVGAGDIRKAVVAFILKEEGAPKSLRALREAVKASIAAHIAATAPDNSEAVAEAEAAQEGGSTEAPVSLVDRVNALSVAYQAASPEAKVAAHTALEALFAMVNADIQATGDAETETETKELEAAE
jgi:hypothetical protein